MGRLVVLIGLLVVRRGRLVVFFVCLPLVVVTLVVDRVVVVVLFVVVVVKVVVVLLVVVLLVVRLVVRCGLRVVLRSCVFFIETEFFRLPPAGAK